ncbi:ferredoxin reductase family protein [Hydrogenophaga sp. 5NK40-0174]|uniref:ferredoxin reductase family protein n=1 Tax=Hydrogenophaga sp. 5NK40-0174 TaxID=3127649 RepID=UPI0031094EDC
MTWSLVPSITGWLALTLWAGSFVLMLRLPWLENIARGMPRLYWWHHATGAITYMTLLLHTASAAVPALAQGQQDSAAWMLNPLAATGPYRWGWIALLALMLMMVVTFWVPLRYRRWRQVHWLVLPAAMAGAWHAWNLAGGAMAQASAWVFALTVLASTAMHAIMRWTAWQAHAYRVEAIRTIRPDLITMDLVAESGTRSLSWKPGQFVFVSFGEGIGWRGCGEWHPYTIAGSVPGHSADQAMRLLIRAQGPCSSHVQHAPAGTQVQVRGPHGRFLSETHAAVGIRPQLWVAGGIGVTPFLAAAQHLTPDAHTEFVHIRRPQDAGLQELIPDPAAVPRGTRLHDLVSHAADLDSIWRQLGHLVPDLAQREVFLCGPPGLVAQLTARLAAAGVGPQHIHSERFDFR